MPEPTKSAPRWARRKDDRPQELLTAALDLFVERGYAATRLEDVCARAGVSKGTLYLYFDSKQTLFKSVVRDHILPVLDEADALVEQFDGPSTDLLRNLLNGWWQRIGNTQLSGITKLMMAEAGNFPELAQFYSDEVLTRSDAMFVRMLERGIRRGEFRNVDTINATRVIVAPVLMMMLWKHSFAPCGAAIASPQEYLDSVIDLCLHGLLTPAAAASAAAAPDSPPVST